MHILRFLIPAVAFLLLSFSLHLLFTKKSERSLNWLLELPILRIQSDPVCADRWKLNLVFIKGLQAGSLFMEVRYSDGMMKVGKVIIER